MTLWDYLDARARRRTSNAPSQWTDPRVWITLTIIGIFTYAYANDPGDQAMKGALIAAFAAAYGFWIGASKVGGELAQNNAAIIRKQAEASPPIDKES